MSIQQMINDAAASGQTELDLYNTKLTFLPNISHLTSLQRLHLTFNNLQTLPTLPSSLREIDVSNNKLQTLPTLPPYLQELYISGNNLRTLPTLPPTLQILHVSNNKLQTLPTLPHTLQVLRATNNCLQSLPTLPPGLQKLDITNNNIRALSDLSYLTKPHYMGVKRNPITHSHINNHFLLKYQIIFNQRDIDTFNAAVSLFTNKSTYFSLLPRDVTSIIEEYISYVPVPFDRDN